MLIRDRGWQFAWDFEASFGLFPNPNHSATLLAMGGVSGVGVLYHSIMSRKWVWTILVGAALGIVAWAILGYSESRLGVALFGLGITAWFIGIGRGFRSHRVLISVIVLGGLTLLLFVASASRAKRRIADTIERAREQARDEPGPAQPDRSEVRESPLGLRQFIFLDTIAMVADGPWAGAGLGTFRYIFPQYQRESVNNSLSVHPESDWLMVAAESGIASALLLSALVATVFFKALGGVTGSRSRPLRLGCLLAAAVVPVHGILDVPGHRIGLALFALFLLAIAQRAPRRRHHEPLRTAGVVGFRLAGLAILFVGVFLLRAEWVGEPVTATIDSHRAAERIMELYAKDRGAGASESGAEAAPTEDLLEQAISVAEAAVARTPLDPELHYLLGAMAIQFDDKEELVDRSFAIQRYLEPTWSDLPLRQSMSWSRLDLQRTIELWRDALDRAQVLADSPSAFEGEPRYVWSRILQQAQQSAALAREALKIADADPNLIEPWIAIAPPEVLAAEMPTVLSSEALSRGDRERLIEGWRRHGDQQQVETFSAQLRDRGG